MRDVKALNGLLWTGNGLLGAGIVLFAFQYLLFPADPDYLEGFDPGSGAAAFQRPSAPRPSDEILKLLGNPLEPRAAPGPGPAAVALFRAELKGTLPSERDARKGFAFIRSLGQNVELVAAVGEEIRHQGKTYEEFRGWKLTTVTKDSATFSDGRKEERLTLDASARSAPSVPGAPPRSAASPALNLSGQAYAGAQYKSRLLASAESRQVWGLDLAEIEWATQNQDLILNQDFSISPYAGGGIRIESVREGSIGAARGLLPGDIVRDINGKPLSSAGDLKALIEDPDMRKVPSVRLTVERAGKPIIMEYRPLPR